MKGQTEPPLQAHYAIDPTGVRSMPKFLNNIAELLTLSVKEQIADLVRTIHGLAGLVGHPRAKALFDEVLQELGGSGSLTIHGQGENGAQVRTRQVRTRRRAAGNGKPRNGKKRQLSPEGRAAIVAAQKARWAAIRTSRKK